jgi:pimeloyl-ACP methyl ester carboxylesterase
MWAGSGRFGVVSRAARRKVGTLAPAVRLTRRRDPAHVMGPDPEGTMSPHTAAVKVSAATGLLLLLASVPAYGQHQKKHAPLHLAEQGTFYVGGKIEFRSPNSSTDINSPRSLPGNIAVHQMYVEYQVPLKTKYRFPIVFMHGGGHTGEFFRTTPDGREGWFTSFTRRGFAVYAVDAPNRGRAGWDPTARFATTQPPFLPPSAMEEANIYSEQSAWVAFRWGPTFGTAYPNRKFPLAFVENYLKEIQPAYRDAPENGYIQNDLKALVDTIGPCILLGWSTGTGNVMMAASQRLYKVKGVIGLEGFPGAEGNRPPDELAARTPFLGILGDNLDPTPSRAYTDTLSDLGGDANTIFLPDSGLYGNGHTMALELNNERIADLIEQWIRQHVPNVVGPLKGK